MKIAKKHENDEFFVITLKHVSVLKVVVNRHRTPNSGQLLIKTVLKHENDEFLLICHKHVRVLTRHANPPGTQKLWAITHENGHKTRKRQAFGHNSQTCIRS